MLLEMFKLNCVLLVLFVVIGIVIYEYKFKKYSEILKKNKKFE